MLQVTRMGGELAPRWGPPLAISAAIIALTQLAMLALAPALADEAAAPPLLLGAMLLTLRGRGIAVGVLLGLAAGVKLWPVLLAPLFGRWLPRSAWLGALIAFGATTLLVLGPLLATIAAPDAGLNAYSRVWSVNNAPMAWAEAILG